ncbi:hypothetical protein DN068_01320 [Taibaiella soli]|uniref:Uncharacterized protein n=1 Tax=Taibaiella soli TaxID=1649169 RepID=A0A2W2B3J1_9BACT|nr:hypothetical protein DN068_01320 [Taibaiella soli]
MIASVTLNELGTVDFRLAQNMLQGVYPLPISVNETIYFLHAKDCSAGQSFSLEAVYCCMVKMVLNTILFLSQDSRTIIFGIGALIVLITILVWMRRQGKR